MPAFYCILLSKHSLFIKLSSCHAIIRLTNVTQVSSTGTPGHILVNRYTRIKPDIVNYLVLQTSWATNQQMKAYKSIDAFNFFVSGWVNVLQMKEVSEDKVVVFARVSWPKTYTVAIGTTHYYDLFCEDKANNSYLFLLSSKSFSKSSRHSFKGMDFSRKKWNCANWSLRLYGWSE